MWTLKKNAAERRRLGPLAHLPPGCFEDARQSRSRVVVTCSEHAACEAISITVFLTDIAASGAGTGRQAAGGRGPVRVRSRPGAGRAGPLPELTANR